MHTHQTSMYTHSFQCIWSYTSTSRTFTQFQCTYPTGAMCTEAHNTHTSCTHIKHLCIYTAFKQLCIHTVSGHASDRCHVHTASRQAFIMHTHPKRMCACLSMPTHQAFPSRRLSGRELPRLATHTHHTATCTRPPQQQTSAHFSHLVQTRTEQHCAIA